MKYGTKVITCMLAAIAIVAGTNYLVDPYGVFSTSFDNRPNNNALFRTHVRLAKAHIVSRFKPEAVILGSSRAEIGLSPQHRGWQFERVYNLALPKGNIQETVEYLKLAIAAGSLKQVVIGLDFFQFNPALEPRPDFDQCRLHNPQSLWSKTPGITCDIPALLLSKKAFATSISSWLSNNDKNVYLRNGSRSAEAKAAAIESAGSQHGAFLASAYEFFSEIELLKGFLTTEISFEEATGPYFEELLRLCHRHQIDLRIFLSPSHAWHLEVIDEMGLWDEFVRWKRYLMAATNEVAKEFDAVPYTIWDFADYNEITTEALPLLSDVSTRMQWYWESSHYTAALGELILDEILLGESTGLAKILRMNEFDVWIQEIEDRKSKYRQATETDLQFMRDYVSSPAKRKTIQTTLDTQN